MVLLGQIAFFQSLNDGRKPFVSTSILQIDNLMFFSCGVLEFFTHEIYNYILQMQYLYFFLDNNLS